VNDGRASRQAIDRVPFSSAGNSLVNSFSFPTSSPKSTPGVFIRMASSACVAHALLITCTVSCLANQ
jgi:hypothetical protein